MTVHMELNRPALLHFFPRRGSTFHDAKQGVYFGYFYIGKFGQPRRIAHSEFAAQVSPFVSQLAGSRLDLPRPAGRNDLARIKAIIPAQGLGMNSGKVGSDTGNRIVQFPEARQLGMVAVTEGLAQQHLLRQ